MEKSFLLVLLLFIGYFGIVLINGQDNDNNIPYSGSVSLGCNYYNCSYIGEVRGIISPFEWMYFYLNTSTIYGMDLDDEPLGFMVYINSLSNNSNIAVYLTLGYDANPPGLNNTNGGGSYFAYTNSNLNGEIPVCLGSGDDDDDYGELMLDFYIITVYNSGEETANFTIAAAASSAPCNDNDPWFSFSWYYFIYFGAPLICVVFTSGIVCYGCYRCCQRRRMRRCSTRRGYSQINSDSSYKPIDINKGTSYQATSVQFNPQQPIYSNNSYYQAPPPPYYSQLPSNYPNAPPPPYPSLYQNSYPQPPR